MNNKIINEIRSIAISKIISEYISITKKGRNYFAICPFHNDTNPSLVINDEKNIFKCFTCNTSGDAIKFVSGYQNIPYSKAILEIANKFNLDISGYDEQNYVSKYQLNYDLNRDYLELCQIYLKQPKFKYAYDYLESRNISDSEIAKFKIGFNPPNNESNIYRILTNEHIVNSGNKAIYKRETLLDNGLVVLNQKAEIFDFFANRIIFAISNENDEIVGFSGRSINNDNPKYLNSSQTIIFNKSEILYNYNNFLKSPNQWSIYIVEGFMDVIALDKADIPNSVATMGTSLTDQHIKMLKQNQKIESVILGFDNDQAGQIACVKNGLLIGKCFNTFVVNHSQNPCKDFDEVLNKQGKEQLIALANNLIHFSVYYLNLELSKFANIADFNHNYPKIKEFLRSYGKLEYINDYLQSFKSLGFYIDVQSIENDLNKIYNINNSKFEFSNRIDPKTTEVRNKNIDNVLEGYNYTVNRLIIACLVDQTIPHIISNNYLIRMDNDLYNVVNVLIEFYAHNPQINAININNIEILKEFGKIHNYNPKIINLIEQKMHEHYQLINHYILDQNTLMKQIYQSQIIKIEMYIANELEKNQQFSIDSIEKAESSRQINKYIKLKNKLIKLKKNLNQKIQL